MKRFLSLTLALAMMLSLMIVSASAAADVSQGDICSANGSTADEVLTSVAPGRTVYVAISEYDSDDKIKKVKLEADDSDSKALVANSSKLEVVKLKVAGGEKWNFAKITVKSISQDKYDEDDDYEYDGTLYITGEETDDEFSIDFTVEYEEQDGSNGTFYDYPCYYTYEKDDDTLDISSEDSNLWLEADITGTGKAVAYVDTDTIDALEDKFGSNANMAYYTCGGTFSRVKNVILSIEADPGKYLYKYESGKLIDLSDSYDRDDDEFHVKGSSGSFTLGTYVVSDAKLSGSTTIVSSSSLPSSSNPANSVISSGSTLPANPNTGAAA